MDAFSRHVLRLSVAQICQVIGYTSIQSSPLEILTDILQEYITGIAKVAARYAMLLGQSEASLHHVELAFKDLGISISELEEYVNYVDSNAVMDVPKYPIPKESHLNHLKPGSREVVTRPVHIHEHLPPMHPHLEDQDYSINRSPLTVDVSTSDNLSPLPSPKGIFKKPGDPISSDPRRGRQLIEDEIRPLREISSVMMTTSGFLSPAREGKLPEARTQPIEFSNPPSPEPPSPEPEQPPEEQPQQLPPPPEIKVEKKKKTKPADAAAKKPDKENKSKDEQLPDHKDSEDDLKGKKLVTTKETSKLKAFKTGALKMQTKPPSPSPSPPPQKKAKLSPNSNLSHNSKQIKVKSPKNEKRSLSPLVKDPATILINESLSVADIKLPSEPDKQKLNIFKKITKIKDDHDESKLLALEQRDNNLSSDAVSQRKLADNITKDVNVRIDVETPNPPVSTDMHPGSPGVEKASEALKIPEPKKKKKDKQKDKKELSGDKDCSPKSKTIMEDSSGKVKSSVGSDLLHSGEDHLPSYVVSPALVPAPGIMPPWNNTVYPPIPPISISTSGSSLVTSRTTEIPSGQQSVMALSPSGIGTISTSLALPNKDNNVQVLKKKERKRDKKLKDKIKKKKDKKEKNKIKDKSERKKLKLEKKEKAKLKLKKEKKEKKKEKEVLANKIFEQSHIAEDILNTLTPWGSDSSASKKLKLEDKEEPPSQVPKITFKLGPASPKDVPETPCPKKIVIKPIVKKEEEGLNPSTSASQEMPKFITVPQKIKTHKGGKLSQQIKSDVPNKPPSFLFPPEQQDMLPLVPKWEADPNKVWICPACGRPDDGSPMIACDICDLWFHWTCVGITEPIEGDWYCKKCVSKRDDNHPEKKKKHRKKKN